MDKIHTDMEACPLNIKPESIYTQLDFAYVYGVGPGTGM